MSRRRRKMSDAELAYESAVPLLEKNAAETGLPGAREKLAITWHNLSRVTVDGEKAKAAMESAVSVIDRLALDAPDDPNVQKDKQYLHKAQREVARRPLRRALILAAFAGVLALLCYGIWTSRIFG